MKWDVLNIAGERVKQVDLSDALYTEEMNEAVLHTAVKAQQANARQGTHATKTRSQVSGTGKKPFRQKGTGNARQGCSRSPLMPGGAILHGPQPRSYRQKVNKSLKVKAFRIAIADKIRHKKLFVVDDFALQQYSAKHVTALMLAVTKEGKCVLSDVAQGDYLHKSSRNIYGACAVAPASLSIVDLLGHQNLVISEAGLAALESRLEGVKK